MMQYNATRLTIIFFIFALLFFLILGNLYYIQVRQTGFFKSLGSHQYYVTVTQTPARAEIYDRNQHILAMNKECISAFIMPSCLEQAQRIKNFLARYFPQAHKRLQKSTQLHFMYIKRRLTAEQVNLIEQSNLPDIKFLKEPSRFYPVPCVASLVGLTDIDNQGALGIELFYNKQLAGKSSTYILEKDARSSHFYFKREIKIQGSAGNPINLTIDSDLQFLVYTELKEKVHEFGALEGAVLITNPENGEILAIANYPDYNPNDHEQVNINNTKNRIVTDAYELGSVIKIFSALAALEEGVVTPDELIDCENTRSTTLNGFQFTTWQAHGLQSFSQVIQHSNNIGIAKVAQRLQHKLYEHYQKLGFGKKINILPGENKGFINSPHQWSRASLISLSFGYEISATLLQLAQALSVIANNGYLVKPKILMSPQKTQLSKKLLYKPETIASLRAILEQTVLQGNSKRAALHGYRLMGKTGTARLLTNGKYDPHRHIFTFACLIEKDTYKRLVITMLKEVKQKNPYASTTAVPLFEHIIQKLLIHDKIL